MLPHYKLNRKDTKELNRQVIELLEKCYIQHSPSPCDIPFLSTPKEMKSGKCMWIVEQLKKKELIAKYRFSIPKFEDMFDYWEVNWTPQQIH